jgi:hypothetical protein
VNIILMNPSITLAFPLPHNFLTIQKPATLTSQ